MEKILYYHNKKSVTLAVLGLTVVALFMTSTRTSALPPFSQRDADSIFVSENYRDEGRTRQVGCPTGDYADTGENAGRVWDFFARLGYKPHVIAGIIGNMQAESGLMPQRLLNLRDGEVINVPAETLSFTQRTARLNRPLLRQNPLDRNTGTAWGIVQFHPPGKFIDTQATITDANILENQLIFLDAQLKGEYESLDAIYERLDGTSTVAEATRIFAAGYERFAREGSQEFENEIPRRITNSEGALARFADRVVAGAPPVVGDDGPTFISSCSAVTENTGSAAAVAEEQLVTGGGNFKFEVPGGNSADFVSWTFQKAGTPFTGGINGGWQYSSVRALQDFFRNTPGYTYFEAGTQPPIRGDVAFYIDENDQQYTDLVVAVNGDTMTVIGSDANGNVTQTTKSTIPGENGLVGFGRADSQQAPPSGGGAPTGPVSPNYDGNLQLIRSSPFRNTTEDNSPFRGTPSASLPVDQLLGPRSEYLGNPGGNPEQSFPVPAGGQNRTGCEFSHFAYDDPLVFPGEPGKSHLHMFFGNTDVNAYSTYDTLLNTGGATCNGGELNRTGYWVPAMFDSNGNVRVPERVVVYYKGEGLARGAARPYPEGAAMIANLTGDVNTISPGSGGAAGQFSFKCSDQFSGANNPVSNTIPNCPGVRFAGVRQVLEMNVKFPQCWSGSNPGDFRNSWRIPVEGGWYFSLCNGTHASTHTNLEYFVNYHVFANENTSGWYLASDVNKNTFVKDKVSGSTTHGDWWGAWHQEINQRWIDNCVNHRNPSGAASGCGFGYLTDGGPNGGSPLPGPALKYRKQYTGPEAIPAQQVFNALCQTTRQYTGPTSAAYCNPNAPPPPPAPPVGGDGGIANPVPGGCITADGYVNPRPGECVGVPNGTSLTPYNSVNTSQDVNITTTQTIDGKIIYGCVNVRAPNVVIRNSKIICYKSRDILNAQVYGNRQWPNYDVPGFEGAVYNYSTNLLLERNEILCGKGAGATLEPDIAPCDYAVGGRNFRARFNDIHQMIDGVFPLDGSTTEYNYIRGMLEVIEEWIPISGTRNNTNRYSHADAVQAEFGGNNIVVRGNFFEGNPDNRGSSGLQAFLANGGGSPPIVVANNRLYGHFKSLRFACLNSACSMTNNVIDDIYRGNTSVFWVTGGPHTLSGNKFANTSGATTGTVTEANIKR